MAGVPNTLPLQDLNRDAELGRVGCQMCRRLGSDPSPWHKTNFYNTLEGAGQPIVGAVKELQLLSKHSYRTQYLIAGIPTRSGIVGEIISLFFCVVVGPNIPRILKPLLWT